MEPKEESALVLSARSRNRGAFEALVRVYARPVWACIYSQARDPAWTEDLVQETFTRAWESIGEIRDPRLFRGWLFTIARRQAWRHAELAGRPLPVPTDSAPMGGDDPEEARERVHEALSRLPERYRVPVALHLLNGMEYDAISRLLGLENGSLRGLIARGTAKLRAELAPWWRNKNEHS